MINSITRWLQEALNNVVTKAGLMRGLRWAKRQLVTEEHIAAAQRIIWRGVIAARELAV